jgi:2,6-dihydroxypseudooxynicotine hydrolase
VSSQPTPVDYVAPTYLLTNVPEFIESITYRMLADGMILQDIRAAHAEVRGWSQWGEFWMARALAHEAAADSSLAKGYRLTAGEHLVRASLCAHYGQFLHFAFPEVKRRGVDLKARLFRRAANLIEPPAQYVEIAYRGTALPGYLRVPPGGQPVPCVVLVGGLDAAKEDAHQFSSLCVARGLATLAFDGPGQGEAYYRGLRMDGTYHRAVSTVIDFLEKRQEIDRTRIGVIGRSTGGFLAPQAAALDSRIKACVAWGAMYDLKQFQRMPPLIIDGFQMVTDSRNRAEAEEAMRFVNLQGLAERLSCPLYVLHAGKDNITPPYNARRLIDEARGPKTLALYEDSIHCNHDVAHIARPDMADWLAHELGAR